MIPEPETEGDLVERRIQLTKGDFSSPFSHLLHRQIRRRGMSPKPLTGSFASIAMHWGLGSRRRVHAK